VLQGEVYKRQAFCQILLGMMVEKRFFAFGVVDKDGQAYKEDRLLSDEKQALQITVDYMNKPEATGHNAERAPFKVVQLVWFN
jgi:hypothetical protein